MNQTQFFDLHQIWVNELIGDFMIFFIVGLIVLWLLSLKAKIPYHVISILTIVWVGLLYSFYSGEMLIFWVLVVLFVSINFYYNISKAISRGG